MKYYSYNLIYKRKIVIFCRISLEIKKDFVNLKTVKNSALIRR